VDAWQATLALQYRRAAERTVLARRHSGPLHVQKALYPEGEALCHTVLVHPPGGIAGGDAIAIDAQVQPQAGALVTTPGATKWYKANGRRASQQVTLQVDGALEWLPQEAIVFDQADVQSALSIDVAADGAMLGWDLVALGRAAAGEAFTQGRFAQTIRLSDAGALQWIERTRIDGSDALLESPIGLAGRRVFGCLWAVGPRWRDDDLDDLRSRLPAEAPITRLAPRLLVARVLAQGTQAARRALEAVWRELRPRVLGRAAVVPRIWAT
jgi:urease accessory protein